MKRINKLCDPFWYSTEEYGGNLIDQWEDRNYLVNGMEKRCEQGIMLQMDFIYDTTSEFLKKTKPEVKKILKGLYNG